MIKPASVYALVLVVFCTLLAPTAWEPVAAAVGTVRCTNPYSGTTWDVAIDYDRRLADSFPAQITQSQITWHDTVRGGYYFLDRASGALTIRYASSTGGFSIHHECRPP